MTDHRFWYALVALLALWVGLECGYRIGAQDARRMTHMEVRR